MKKHNPVIDMFKNKFTLTFLFTIILLVSVGYFFQTESSKFLGFMGYVLIYGVILSIGGIMMFVFF